MPNERLQELYKALREDGTLKENPRLAELAAALVKDNVLKDLSGGTNYAKPAPQASAPSISQYSLPAPGTPPPPPTPQPSMRVPGVTMRPARSLYDVAKSLPADIGAPAKAIQPAQKAKTRPAAKPTYVQKPKEATGKTYSDGSMPATAPPRNVLEESLAGLGIAVMGAGRALENTAPVQALEDSGMMDTRRMIAGLPVDVFMGTTAGAAILDARRRGDNKAAAQVMRDVLAAQGSDATGAFSRAAAGSTLPTAGGLYGAGVAGRAALPLAKMTGSPLGAMAVEGIAATGGAILGTAGVQNVQDKTVASILGPDAYKEFQAQQAIDQQVNPTAVKAGSMVPLAATLSPNVMSQGLAQAPQALRDVRATGLAGFGMPAAKAAGTDVAQRVVGAAVPTAINQVVEWTQGKDVDIEKAIADMALFSFTKPNALGGSIAGAGSRTGQAGLDVAAQAKQGASLYKAVRSEAKSPTTNSKTNADQFKEYAAAFHPDKHQGLTPQTQEQLTRMMRNALSVKAESSERIGVKGGQDAFWRRLGERAQTLINTDPANVAARAAQGNKKPLQIEGTKAQPSEAQGTLTTQKEGTNVNQEAAGQGNAGGRGVAPAGAAPSVPDQGRTPVQVPAPAASTAGTQGTSKGLKSQEVAPEDLGIMPGIQYKRGVNKEGVTDLLKGQGEYQVEHGGTLTAYRDAQGNLYAVDGHHRRELAQRASKFTAPLPGGGRVEVPRKLNIQVLDAAEGWTPEEARSFGVLKNLRENKGVAIDAADALVKTHSADAARADARRLPPTPLARDVSGLVLLDEAGRALVRNKQVDGSVAAAIGEVLRGDVQRQRIALEQAMKTDGVRSYDDGAALARAVRDEEIARKQGGQESMFGDEAGGTDFQSTAGEQAAIRAVVKKRLAAEQSSLLAVDKTEARAGEVFDTEGRRKEAGSVRDAKSKADALFEYDPDVKAALRQAASDVANGRIGRDEGAKRVREIVLKNGALTLAEIVKKGNIAAPVAAPTGGGLFGDEPAKPAKAEGIADMFAEPEPTKAPEPVKKPEPVKPAQVIAQTPKAEQEAPRPTAITKPEPVEREAPKAETLDIGRKDEYKDFLTGKQVWDLTPEEITKSLEFEKTRGKQIEDEILGERAADWRKAQNMSNSMDSRRAAEGDKAIKEIESGLTEAQVDRLYGMGESGVDTETLQELKKDYSRINNSETPEELGSSIGRDLVVLKGKTDMESMNHSQKMAMARVRYASSIATTEGWDFQDVLRAALVSAGKQFSSAGDFAELMGDYLKMVKPTEAKAEEPVQKNADALTRPAEPVQETAKIEQAKPEALSPLVEALKAKSMEMVSKDRSAAIELYAMATDFEQKKAAGTSLAKAVMEILTGARKPNKNEFIEALALHDPESFEAFAGLPRDERVSHGFSETDIKDLREVSRQALTASLRKNASAATAPAGAVVPEGAPKGLTFYEDMPKALPASSVIHVARNSDGGIEGAFVMPHQGTEDSMRTTALEAKDFAQEETEFIGRTARAAMGPGPSVARANLPTMTYSGIQSITVATDADGKISHAISGNGKMIAPIGSVEARAIAGDMDAFRQVKEAQAEMPAPTSPTTTSEPTPDWKSLFLAAGDTVETESGERLIVTSIDDDVDSINSGDVHAQPVGGGTERFIGNLNDEDNAPLRKVVAEAPPRDFEQIAEGLGIGRSELDRLGAIGRQNGGNTPLQKDAYQKARDEFDEVLTQQGILKDLIAGKTVAPETLAKYPALAKYATDTTVQETKSNESSSSANLERDRTDADVSDLVGEASVSPIRGADNRAPGGGVLTPQEPGDSPYRSEPVPSPEATPSRKRGDKQVRDAAPTTGAGLEESAPGSDEPARSGDLGLGGLSPESTSAGAVRAASSEGTRGAGAVEPTFAELVERQKAAESIPVKLGDIDNIRETLPVLKPAQQDDVLFAENRFAAGKEPGVLFTNGTGTGKTFTGLGIIKRFSRQGRNNILIAAPSQEIIDAWISNAPHLDLAITQLDDTKGPGEGIVATTYANLSMNLSLGRRDWDLVLCDEAHKLMSNKEGDDSLASDALQAITLHPAGVSLRTEMLYPELSGPLAEARAERLAAENNTVKSADGEETIVKDMARFEKADALVKKLSDELYAKRKIVQADVEARQGDRTKVVFLSATPFAYEKTTHYAEGYLFSYPREDGSTRTGYNIPVGRDKFMVDNFGWSMRTNKLTQPSAEVDRALLQREFNNRLKREGALSGRALDVPFDYDRKFILAESAIGTKIDQGLKILWENDYYRPLWFYVQKKFGFLEKRYLLEALKAKEAIPIIRQHLALGRKVVLFHDYNKGGTDVSPFDMSAIPPGETVQVHDDWKRGVRTVLLSDIAAKFQQEHPEYTHLPIGGLKSPIEAIKAAFPDVLQINGLVTKKESQNAVRLFQDDDSGRNLVIVQSAKGSAGISLHDTTGKFQRVQINLGMPLAPTTAIQEEGRIFRVGQASNAIIRYMTTGTNWERGTFAQVASKSGEAENLALGEGARALRDQFVQAYMDADAWAPGHEGEGTGGKEADLEAMQVTSAYDRAKTYYFQQMKKTSRTKAMEGVDYFATPEPIGFKMVEWLDPRKGEALLEPSAGHAAIARWFPLLNERTLVEPSAELSTKAMAAVPDARVIQGRFEDLHITNKYEGIAMNPPFGSGGKTAFEHLEKAYGHLSDGGRIVALVPTGPAADKRLDKFLNDFTESPLRPIWKNSPLGEIYKGDHVKGKMYSSMSSVSGVATMASSSGNWVEVKDAGGKTHRLYYLETLDATGPRSERIRARGDLAVVAKIKMPSVAFDRAGTSVATQILVLERNRSFSSPTREIDLSDITDIKELFDEMEHLGMGRRDARLVKSQDSSLEKVPEKPKATPSRARGEDDLLESPTLPAPEAPSSLHTPSSHADDLEAPVAPVSARVKIAPIPWDRKPLADPGTLINALADATGRAVMVARQKRGVAGSYRPSNARTTIRFYGDMETTAHEIGHAMDDLFNLVGDYSGNRQKSPWDAELLQDAFQATAKTGMKLSLRRAEAVAEFMRAYALNPAEAEALAPTFTAHMKKTLSPKVVKAFEDFGVGARRLAGAPATEAAQTHILWGEGDQRSIRERLLQGLGDARDAFTGGQDIDEFRLTLGDKLTTNFQDYLRPVVAASEWARKLTGAGATLPENDPILLMRLHNDTVGKVGQMLETGFVDTRGEKVIDPDTGEAIGGLSWILEKALRPSVGETEKMMRLAAILGVAERTLEKGQQLKRDTVLTGIGMGLWDDASTAKAVLTELDQLPQAVKDDLAETMRRYRVVANALLAYMADSGRITHEDAQVIMDENQQYISLQRVMEDAPLFEGTGTSRRLATVAQPVKKLKGSMRQLRDPFVSLLDQTYKIVAESDRNRAIDSFVDLFRSDRKLYKGDVTPLSDVMAQTDSPSEGKSIKVFHNGEAQHWEINDPDVYRAIKGLGLPAAPTGLLRIVAAITAKIPRALITSNPAFAIRNVMRDMPERWLKDEFDSLPWDSFKKFSEEERTRYALAGGTGMGFYGASRAEYAKAIKTVVKDAASKGHLIRLPSEGPLESYQKLLQRSEIQGRMPAYRSAFRYAKDKLGYDDYNAGLYAAGKAREIMDFAVAGNYLRAISPYVAFVNANIQGFTANYKAARANPKKFALKFLLFSAMRASVVALIATLFGKDKIEEYRALPAYQRDLCVNLPLPWPDGWLSIPVGFEAAVASAGIERTLDYAMGNKDAYLGYFTPADAPGDQNTALKILSGSLAQSFLPVKIESLLSFGGGIGALNDIRSNRDSFRQTNIVSPFEVDLPVDKRQGAAKASRAGKLLGKVFSSDPRALDHFVQTVGGGSGTIVTTLSDMGREDKPITGTRALGMTNGLFKEGPGYGAPQVQRALTQLKSTRTQPPVVLKRAQDDLKAAKTPTETEKAKAELRKAASGPMVPAAINLTTSKRDLADARIEKLKADRAKEGKPPLTAAQEEGIRRAIGSALGRATRPVKKDETGVRTNAVADKIEARANAIAPTGLARMGRR